MINLALRLIVIYLQQRLSCCFSVELPLSFSFGCSFCFSSSLCILCSLGFCLQSCFFYISCKEFVKTQAGIHHKPQEQTQIKFTRPSNYLSSAPVPVPPSPVATSRDHPCHPDLGPDENAHHPDQNLQSLIAKSIKSSTRLNKYAVY